MRNSYLPLISIFFVFTLHAQVREEVYHSYFLEQDRELMYYVPEDYNPEREYPLILVLDAEYLFELVVANTRFYHRNYRMPQAIVVGVRQGTFDLRWYDCDYEQDNGLPTNRSMAFYDFLQRELLPKVEESFSISDFKMFVGYDITANFGNYFLFEDRSPFRSYLIVSPLLAEGMDERIPARLSALDQPIDYHLILERERAEGRNSILQLNNGIRAVDKESLNYSFDEYDYADHVSVVTYGIGKAFDEIFRDYRPITQEEFEEEVMNMEIPVYTYLSDKYDRIERLLGYRKDYDLRDIMYIYMASKERQDVESLKFLHKEVKKNFPDTMMADYIEGELFEIDGQTRKALKAFGRAFMQDEISYFTRERASDKIAALRDDME